MAGDTLFRWLTWSAAAAILAVAAVFAVVLLEASVPSLIRFGPRFLSSSQWNPVEDLYGAWPFIYGTLHTSGTALLLAAPIGIATALAASEVAGRRVGSVLGLLVELLAAIPSVVYGLWGIFVLIPWLRQHVETPVSARLGAVPLFAGPVFGPGLLPAGLVLAIMVLPTVTAISREVFLAVPESRREAAYALGATRWEMIRSVLWPASRAGLLGAVVLALGRALGETMAVTMVIGNSHDVSLSLFAPGNTMSSIIANEFAEATHRLQLAALMEIALLLFLITLLVNLVTRRILARGHADAA